jgi:recombination protein RecA
MAQRLSSRRRAQLLAEALRLIEERFGPGTVRRLRAPRSDCSSHAIPSGSLALDLVTGLDGLPRGGVTELVGAETSGKTALLYACLAATQRQGGIAALVDAEGSAEAEALAACGVDLDDLLLVRPASAPDALLLLTILARCGGLDTLGLSSIAALRDLPAGSVRGAADGDLAAPDLARLLARGLRVLTVALKESPTAIVATNDLLPYQPEYRSPGGLALRHHTLLRIMIEPLARLPDAAGGTSGLRVGLTIAKNKVGVPGGRAVVDLLVGYGVDWPGELLRLALDAGLITRQLGGLLYGAELLGRGDHQARQCLERDPDLALALRTAIVATAHSQAA